MTRKEILRDSRYYSSKANRSETIELASTAAYEAFNLTPSKSRKRIQCQVRAAIGVSLSPYCTTTEIGKVLLRDRSSVSHYTSNHLDNLEFWGEYKVVYNIIKPMIESIIFEGFSGGQIESLDNKIKALTIARDMLIANR